jgi:hypothetical protein
MSQQQRHQLGLSAEPSTQPGLHLRTAEQQLLAAWEIVQGACSICCSVRARLFPLSWLLISKEVCRKGQESAKGK